MKKFTAASVAIALMTSTSALAQTVKYDVSIAKAAAAKAAEKIGDIRGTIGYDQIPDMVTKEDLVDKQVNTSFLPAPSKSLPPISYLPNGIDLRTTGSIQKTRHKPEVIWEKFDRNGNPIK